MRTYVIEQGESKRYDALKTLMCVFVLVIHAFSTSIAAVCPPSLAWPYQITFSLSRIVCDCAVPVFILISSVLLYAKPFQWWPNVKKKVRSLLVPYLIFNTLWVVRVFAKHILGEKLGIRAGDDVDLAAFSLFDWLDAYLGLREGYKPILSTLWYVRDLFLLNLLALPIKKLVDRFPMLTLVVLLLLWVCDVKIPVIQAYSLIFFILGYYLVRYDIHFRDLDRMLNKYLVGAVFLALLVADILLRRQIIPLHRVFLLVSVITCIRVSGLLCSFPKTIALIMPVSYFIYLTHRFVYAIIEVVLPRSMTAYLAAYVCKPAIALAVLVGVYYFLRRYLPGLLGVLTGGRTKKTKK